MKQQMIRRAVQIGLHGELFLFRALVVLGSLGVQKKSSSLATIADADKGVSVVLLNYNGEKILAETLPALREAVKHTAEKTPCEVIFVDNGSNDESAKLVQDTCPDFQILRLPYNHSFAAGNTLGVQKAQYNNVIVISNDMIVEKDSFTKLWQAKVKSGAFGISPQQFFWDTTKRREETGLTRLFLHHGEMSILHADLQGRSKTLLPAFWAGAGFAVYDRQQYLELQGFSLLYEPIYWEDVDLSYRAWRRGWASYVLPEVHVQHKHQGTTKTMYQERFMRILRQRNSFLFFLANVLDGDLLWPYMKAEIAKAAYLASTGNWENALALQKAFVKIVGITRQRRQELSVNKESDQITFWRANGGQSFPL